MVAHLLSLRWLVLRNTLRRHPWQLVGVLFGAIYGLGVLALIVAGLVALSFAPLELARTVTVIGGSAAVLGWVLIPIITAGMEQTLDPARLVNFPIPLNQLVFSLAICGVLGIPGIITSIAALGTVATWWMHPVAALVAVVASAIGVLTCVVGSRAVTSVFAGFSSRRRFRELVGILVFIPLILLGPIITIVSGGIRDSAEMIPDVATALGWSPFGAAWAVPGDVAAGSFGTAAVKFVIAVASLALLAWLWRRSLANELVTPVRPNIRRADRGKLGFFGLFPATPTGAVAARALTYWYRDPRYARSLIIVPLIPVIVYFNAVNAGSLAILTATAPFVALILAVSLYADISYDNTAFDLHVSSTLSGVADRFGRVIAMSVFAVPIVLALAVASVAIADVWHLLPAIVGLSMGLLLTGYGVSSVSSTRFVFAVPAPGDNPFKSNPGTGFAGSLSLFGTWGVLLVLALPEIVLGVAALFTGAGWLSWLTLVLGLGLGTLFMILGVRIGGRQLDARAPELMAQLTRLR